MFVSFLMPYPIRGQRANHLWVFYRQLAALPPAEVLFVGGPDYFRPPADHAPDRPWEFNPHTQAALGFRIPTAAEVAAARTRALPDPLFDPLLAESATLNQGWSRLLTAEYGPLTEALAAVFGELVGAGERVEAVLTWINCPSLSAAAGRFGVPVIHHELGALRRPTYRPTVYLDFRGVNGNTEAADRYEAFRAAPPPLLTRAELIALVSADEPEVPAPPPEFDLGLALQVENDSNMLAFAGGLNNQELYWAATREFPPARVAVRQHPSGYLDYRRLVEAGSTLDDSPTAADFVRRCRAVATINSSVGLEAMLLGRPACVLGDSPFRFIGVPRLDGLTDPTAWPPPDLDAKLNFAVLGYHVPESFLFDVGYYRWRLGRPSEAEVYARHLDYYRSIAAAQAVTAAEAARAELAAVREASAREAAEVRAAAADERAAADAARATVEAELAAARVKHEELWAAVQWHKGEAERFEQEAGQAATALASAGQEVERLRAEVERSERALAHAQAEVDRVGRELADARAGSGRTAEELQRQVGESVRLAEELRAARERAAAAEGALAQAEAGRGHAAASLAETAATLVRAEAGWQAERDRLAAAAAEAHRLRAEVDALAREVAWMRTSKFWKLRGTVRGLTFRKGDGLPPP